MPPEFLCFVVAQGEGFGKPPFDSKTQNDEMKIKKVLGAINLKQ
jgi:hypothetical protein